MVDPLIEELVAEFIVLFNNSHESSTTLPLDYSYDSLARVETFLRSIDLLGGAKNHEQFIKSASAYIGLCAYEILKKLNRKQTIKISLRTIPTFEIFLEINSKYEGISKVDLLVPIYSSLKQINATKSGSLKFFDTLETPILPNTRKYLNFCTGIIAGASPFATGIWREKELAELAPELDQITSVLAIERNKINSLNFPSSKILSDPNFYKYNLLLPPLGYEETAPGLRTISVITSALFENHPPNEIQRTILALLSSADEVQSNIGYILCSTVKDETLWNLAANFASTFWPSTKELRPAALLANTLSKQEGHWLKVLGNKDKNLSLSILRRDQLLGLCPYLVAPIEESMINQEHILFMEMVTLSKLSDAYNLSAIFTNKDALPTWLQYQILFLETFLGKLSNFNELHEKLDNLIQENHYHTAWDLKSRIALLTGDVDLAFTSLKKYLEALDKNNVLAKDKNLINLFLSSLRSAKVETSKIFHFTHEIKDHLLKKDRLLSYESLYLINSAIKDKGNIIKVEELSPMTQLGLKNSTWSPYFQLRF